MTLQSGTPPSMIDLYDPGALTARIGHPGGGVRLPDDRALSWAEYGSPRGVPCLLLPDTGSSRLAPRWLMHDTTPQAQVRVLALDRPGIGASDRVGPGGQLDLVQDLHHLVNTLAVGRIAVIGIGQGASEALAFAARHPSMLSTVLLISPRMSAKPSPRRPWWRPPSWSAATVPASPVAAWLRAAGPGADLTAELTWERATHRMDARSAQILGQRWQNPAFRQGLADDLNLARSWTAKASPPPPLAWEQQRCPVPVRIWHGKDESDATAARVRVVADLNGWPVTIVDDCSALFGDWQHILAAAADSFQQAVA